MRSIAGIFGAVCGLVIVAVVSRYGYRTADNEIDAYIWSFLFGMIALGGLGAHALATRVWRESRTAAVLIGIIGCAALVINLSNSLGAMAWRNDKQSAERIQIAELVASARADLSRIQTERGRLEFTPADAEAVVAASQAFTVAEDNRKAECDVRGSRCREREGDERTAASALAVATSNKALTDQAARFDAEIKRLKGEIADAGPVLDDDAQGSVLAKLFALPETYSEWLSTSQQFAMAVVAELLIVFSLIAFELLRTRKPEAIDIEPIEIIPPKPQERQPPRLVASQSIPVGSPALIVSDMIEPGRGRIEFAELYNAYADECGKLGCRTVTPEKFGGDLKRLCRETGIRIEPEGTRVFLCGVKMKKKLHSA